MKITEAIGIVNDLIPNTYTDADKLRWLSTLDGKIKAQIIDTHEGAGEQPFTGYDEDTQPDTELLAKAPYDNIYPLYLEMQINYYYGETARYNNAANRFAEAWKDFAGWYNQTHRPLQQKRRFW